MTARTRIQRIERERAQRAAAVGQRIVKQLSDADLAALSAGFEQFSDSELERMAAGAFAPQVDLSEIDAATIARLCDLCEDDGERRLLGLNNQFFKHPTLLGCKNSVAMEGCNE